MSYHRLFRNDFLSRYLLAYRKYARINPRTLKCTLFIGKKKIWMPLEQYDSIFAFRMTIWSYHNIHMYVTFCIWGTNIIIKENYYKKIVDIYIIFNVTLMTPASGTLSSLLSALLSRSHAHSAQSGVPCVDDAPRPYWTMSASRVRGTGPGFDRCITRLSSQISITSNGGLEEQNLEQLLRTLYLKPFKSDKILLITSSIWKK